MSSTPLGVSNIINVRGFLEEWGKILSTEDVTYQTTEELPLAMAHHMGVKEAVIKELEELCRLDTLKCPLEPKDLGVDIRKDLKSMRTIPDGVKLATTDALKECLQERNNSFYYNNHLRKYFSDIKSDAALVQRIVGRDVESIPPNDGTLEALITVRIYKPLKNYELLKPLGEYQVLGSQCLTELRDVIKCREDSVVPGELSENPNVINVIKSKDLYKGGLFYIEGVFFNDTRDPSNVDYSRVILEWAQKPSRCVGPFQKESMQEYRFVDLNIRLGLPYVYMHQGNCEHLMVFTDIRVLEGEDVWDTSCYPLLTTKYPDKQMLCICCTTIARWLVKRSKYAPSAVSFFCDSCFQTLHYQDGVKNGDFEAFLYPYDDNNSDTLTTRMTSEDERQGGGANTDLANEPSTSLANEATRIASEDESQGSEAIEASTSVANEAHPTRANTSPANESGTSFV